MLDPFQPGPNFGNFSGSDGGGMGGMGSGGFGSGRHGSGGFNQMSGANTEGMGMGGMSMSGPGMGGRRGSGGGPVFPDSGVTPGSSKMLYGSTPLSLPTLNQLLRGSMRMPLSSSTGSLRFTYQDTLRSGASLGDLARPATSLMFTTSDLGNGVFFSAGTGYGRSALAGAPAAGLSSNTSPEGKHSGPSLNLKLSF